MNPLLLQLLLRWRRLLLALLLALLLLPLLSTTRRRGRCQLLVGRENPVTHRGDVMPA